MPGKKISTARRAAFLKALSETGNQTLAAERARVSRSWVFLERGRDPEFDAAVRAAAAAFGEAPSKDGGRRPPPAWRWFEGAELVVRGCNSRRAQIRRARLDEWTPRPEARFLWALARSCNARAAYAEAGKSKSSAYAHRKRRRDFAESWARALDQGYARIDSGLVGNAIRRFDPEVRRMGPPDLPMAPITVSDAIRILRIYERRGREVRARRRGG